MSVAIDNYAAAFSKDLNVSKISTKNVTLTGAEPSLTLESSNAIVLDAPITAKEAVTFEKALTLKEDAVFEKDLHIKGNLLVSQLTSDSTSQSVTAEVLGISGDDGVPKWKFQIDGDGNLLLKYDDVVKFKWRPEA